MRVLRLDLNGGSVELHPYVTVVRGMAPDRREELLAALAALPAGTAPVPGLLEAYGVLLDLTTDTLQMLDLVTPAEVVVRPQDLPTGPGVTGGPNAAMTLARAEAAATAAEEAAARARRAYDAACDALAAARSGSGSDHDALASSRAELARLADRRAEAEAVLERRQAAAAAAVAAVADADAAAESTRRVKADATQAVAFVATALDAATDRRDPMAPTALEAAQARLAEAEAAVTAARAGTGDADGVAVVTEALASDDELDAMRAERVEAEAAALALDTGDPFPVRLALEQLQAPGAVELVPDPEALALADELTKVDAALDRLAASAPPDTETVGGDERARARSRLAAAEAAVAAAEATLRGPAVDPADVEALEAAHALLLEARDSADRRFRRGDANSRVTEAEEAEQAALDRVGYSTYTDYLMGVRGDGSDVGIGSRVDAARAELAAATAAVQRLDSAVAEELRRAQLQDRRREVRDAAVALLGEDPGDDVTGALRRRRVSATETGEHLLRLRSALEAVGLVLGDEELPERTLADLARVWLEEQERAAAERRELEQRVTALDVRLAEMLAARRAAVEIAASGDVSPLAATLAAVDEAREAVEVAKARAARHDEAEAEVERRRRDLEESSRNEQLAVAAMGEFEVAVARASEVERDASITVAEAEAALASAHTAEQHAAEVLAGLEERYAGTGADRIAGLEADVEAAGDTLAEASAEVDRRAAELDAARATAAAEPVAAQVSRSGARSYPVANGMEAAVEDAEWFLLARLASQRAVSFAGSVPLVLDDALAGFDADSSRRLLARLERMASTVQVVVVTEDLVTASWAQSLGPERAVVVQQ